MAGYRNEAGVPVTGDFWVFGYGSLMWNPGFEFLERREARLYGYHRAFCVVSIVHRGTPERPGLVLGLDHGGSCRGMAFRVAAPARSAVLDYLHAREMIRHVYRPRWVPAHLPDRTVPAYTFVVDREHESYRLLDVERAAHVIAQGHGQGGSNLEYLLNTLRVLGDLGIRDRRLLALRDAALSGSSPGIQSY